MSFVKEYADKKAIIFTDFDGTVTLQDSNDYLTENLGFGLEKRLELNDKILNGTISFREAFSLMLESIPTPFDECIQYLLKNIQLDPGFKEIFHWAQENDIPIIVVSSGMKPIIRALLENLVGEDSIDKIEIVSNDCKVNPDNTWEIVYRDETPFGHDKSRAIKPYREARNAADSKQVLFYCGDGVSDLSAARETDLLFAKRGKDLVTICRRDLIPFTQFDSFKDILANMKSILSGVKTIDDLDENKP
ncbi:Pdp3-interacting factor 1 [Cyberlindnera fabianii]|uniref:Pdp3-interacting factor 1 n=1 Tax=Cyberlindnera fabianii TaxID=36022 RepID=A0A1V2LDD4_CYBFA|nr:Pdp3-interacting factor 1 [Cyberlindnera fabianii]